MKYAIAHVADQTIMYHCENGEGEGGSTTKHPEAKLYDDLHDASTKASGLSVEQAIFLKNGGHEGGLFRPSDKAIVSICPHWVEAVEDVAEFRAREDTW